MLLYYIIIIITLHYHDHYARAAVSEVDALTAVGLIAAVCAVIVAVTDVVARYARSIGTRRFIDVTLTGGRRTKCRTISTVATKAATTIAFMSTIIVSLSKTYQ